MQHSREYQVLLEACKQTGCVLCRLAHESTYHYLDAWQYELFTDVDLQKELRRSQGFCHTHTWQLAHMGASLQLAQNYRAVLSDTMEQLQAAEGKAASGGILRRFFDNGQELGEPQTACPACLQQKQAEVHLVHTLRHALLDPEFYTVFADSSGLCLAHLHLASELKLSDTPGNWLSQLRKGQMTCLQRLDQQLGELIRKHDYRFKDEERGDEMVSWIRASGLVAGEEYNSLLEESPFFQKMVQQKKVEATVRGAQRIVTTVVETRFPGLTELAQERVTLVRNVDSLDQLVKQLVVAPDETVAKELLDTLAA